MRSSSRGDGSCTAKGSPTTIRAISTEATSLAATASERRGLPSSLPLGVVARCRWRPQKIGTRKLNVILGSEPFRTPLIFWIGVSCVVRKTKRRLLSSANLFRAVSRHTIIACYYLGQLLLNGVCHTKPEYHRTFKRLIFGQRDCGESVAQVSAKKNRQIRP